MRVIGALLGCIALASVLCGCANTGGEGGGFGIAVDCGSGYRMPLGMTMNQYRQYRQLCAHAGFGRRNRQTRQPPHLSRSYARAWDHHLKVQLAVRPSVIRKGGLATLSLTTRPHAHCLYFFPDFFSEAVLGSIQPITVNADDTGHASWTWRPNASGKVWAWCTDPYGLYKGTQAHIRFTVGK